MPEARLPERFETESDWNEAFQKAVEASRRAYAPYSHFPVGAALVLKDGTIVQGCNIENASYPLGNCAERSALFSALSMGHAKEELEGILIYTPTETLTSPCGACRQVMAELMGPQAYVILTNGQRRKVFSVEELLPEAFTLL